MDHRAEMSMNRGRAALRNGVRHRDHLHIERPGFEAPLERDLVDRNLEPPAMLRELGFQHSRREWRRIHGHTEARPKIDHRADMILVRMRDDDAGERRALLFDEADVWKDDVDAWIVLALRKGDAEVDHQPLPVVLRAEPIEVGVHADLTETAQRKENEFFFPVRLFALAAAASHLPAF